MGCHEQKEEGRDKSYYNNQGKGGQGHMESLGIFTGDYPKSKAVRTHTCYAIVLCYVPVALQREICAKPP